MITITTTAAVIALIVMVAVMALVGSFISAIIEQLQDWRMRAERYEELYDREIEMNGHNNIGK